MNHPYYYTTPMQRYASPFSTVSSAVSTPAITPPLVPMLDAMIAHQPSFLGSQEAIISKISELQAQTSHLVSLLRQPQQYHPSFIAPPSPSIPPYPAHDPYTGLQANSEAYAAARAVFASVPPSNHMDESVLARAVVAAANALVGHRTGHIADLRQPEAVRAQTPAWLSQAACAEDSCTAPDFGTCELKSPSTVLKCARGLEYKE